MAPTDPGIPESASMPARPSATVCATSASHGSPAATWSVSPARSMPRVAIADDASRKPGVGDHEVRPAGEDQQRRAVAIGVVDLTDHGIVAHGFDEPAGGPAEPERREVGQQHA